MVGRHRVKIQFLDDQRLALAWLTSVEISEKPIGPAIDVPSHLHLAILDARTGHPIEHHEWPCSSIGVNLAYTASGQWLLSSDQTITLYSSSFDEVRDLDNVRTESWGHLCFGQWAYLPYTRPGFARRMVRSVEGLIQF